MSQLWEDDEPMPKCYACQADQHPLCVDLYEHPQYGLVACGCDDPSHAEE